MAQIRKLDGINETNRIGYKRELTSELVMTKTKDKTKILGDKFKNIKGNHLKHLDFGGKKTRVFTV